MTTLPGFAAMYRQREELPLRTRMPVPSVSILENTTSLELLEMVRPTKSKVSI